MRFSTRAHYAVRAMLDLALHEHNGPVPIQEIARRQSLSPSYLEQLFGKLRRGAVIQSVRGVRGGYQLARPAEQVNLFEILQLVDEAVEPAACLDGQRSCGLERDCMTQGVWRQLGERIRSFLTSVTLEQLRAEALEAGGLQSPKKADDSEEHTG